MKILALDPATHCGWAHSCGAGGTWDLSVRRDESSGMRLIRFAGKMDELLRNVGMDLVVFEAARNTKFGGALVVQAEIQGVLKKWCYDHEQIPNRGYSASEIKKHATGKGNAGKPDMIRAAKKAGWNPVDDNHADALWLLHLAMSEYSGNTAGPAAHGLE